MHNDIFSIYLTVRTVYTVDVWSHETFLVFFFSHKASEKPCLFSTFAFELYTEQYWLLTTMIEGQEELMSPCSDCVTLQHWW